ncbi:MAG: transposase [Candidatus Paceibacterota bacterium]|jgi:putative transposase
MPKRRIEFISGEIYHVMVRGIEKRDIFMDDQDYWRGIFSLYEFNNSRSVVMRGRRENRKKYLSEAVEAGRSPASTSFREEFVSVLAFVFMPNHIHLLLRQEKEGGVSGFLQKLNTGYVKYFNEKYKRVGPLFQGRFKAMHIENNEYLKTIFVYIHTNPLAIIEPGWKEKGISDVKRSKEFLKEYRWSSYLDYLGIYNFPSVTQRDLLHNIMGGKEGIKDFVDTWIGYKKEVNNKS